VAPPYGHDPEAHLPMPQRAAEPWRPGRRPFRPGDDDGGRPARPVTSRDHSGHRALPCPAGWRYPAPGPSGGPARGV